MYLAATGGGRERAAAPRPLLQEISHLDGCNFSFNTYQKGDNVGGGRIAVLQVRRGVVWGRVAAG